MKKYKSLKKIDKHLVLFFLGLFANETIHFILKWKLCIKFMYFKAYINTCLLALRIKVILFIKLSVL